MATVSYQLVRIRWEYSSSGTATWSHTPTNEWPVASAFWATVTRSATVASSSHGSTRFSVRVWIGSWMP